MKTIPLLIMMLVVITSAHAVTDFVCADGRTPEPGISCELRQVSEAEIKARTDAAYAAEQAAASYRPPFCRYNDNVYGATSGQVKSEISSCTEHGSVSNLPFTVTFPASSKFTLKERGEADDGSNYYLGGASISNLKMRYTVDLLPSDVEVYVNDVKVDSKAGMLGDGLITVDVKDYVNKYCQRDLGNYLPCVVPIAFKANIGGKMNVKETLHSLPMPDECQKDADCEAIDINDRCVVESTPNYCAPKTAVCGDGKLSWPLEVCDVTQADPRFNTALLDKNLKANLQYLPRVNLGGNTCQSLGYSYGTLGCSADCRKYDTSKCVQAARSPPKPGQLTIGSPYATTTSIFGGTDTSGLTPINVPKMLGLNPAVENKDLIIGAIVIALAIWFFSTRRIK